MVVRPSKGGAFGHVARLGRALTAEGHEVMVAGPHAAHRADLGFAVAEVEMGRAIEPGVDLAALRSLKRVARDFRPDVIHAHGSKGGVLARVARLAAPRTPLVFTPHNYAFTNFFSSASERAAYRAIELALGPLATRTLCVCEAEARTARSVTRESRIRVVHNGIEPFEPPAPSGRYATTDGPLLVAVTEFNEPKGVPSLIEAMPAIAASVPGARLAIAGDGPMRPEVEALVAASPARDATTLLGQIDSVRELLGDAAVFVSPSWSESFPYAILEAMCARLPIVATDVGGVGEAIADGATGRLVAARDPSALSAAVLGLLADQGAAQALAAAARERMLERFTFERMVEGTLAVYGEVGLR